ncbi:MAG: hypothetical protein ABJH68_11740 [Ilumatobacter sp.]|uniref:hypothetical protein n=1 Tax=Ilumatobacter sp. TaxID=1967498 RepID=UPI0032988CC4
MNKIRTGVLGALVAGGSILGVTGIAAAATDTTSTDTTVVAPAPDTATDTDTDTASDEPGQPGGPDAGPDVGTDRTERREAHRAEREADRQEIADVLGITVEDLGEQMRGGATLAEIAEANGVDVATVVDVIVQQRTERLDEAVANGRITAEEAAEITADLPDRVQTRVEEGLPRRGDGEGPRGGRDGSCDRGPSEGDATGPADDVEAPAADEDDAGS